MLTDTFGRVHDYLRISLTDACDLKCTYCNPGKLTKQLSRDRLMNREEIARIAREFVRLGVKKIRITGGEPLVRADAKEIIASLSALPVELAVTTNGTRVHDFIRTFNEAGIRSVNVSLDSLDEAVFRAVTGSGDLRKVLRNIDLLLGEGFRVSINVVVMRGVNSSEIPAFISLTKERPLHVRFIEFMPFEGNGWSSARVFTSEEVLNLARTHFSFDKIADNANGTAKAYKPSDHAGTFAVISPMSEPFCNSCNRIRLTADGKVRNCLFSKTEIDILGALRSGRSIEPLLRQCLLEKKMESGGQILSGYRTVRPEDIVTRKMISIGG